MLGRFIDYLVDCIVMLFILIISVLGTLAIGMR